MRVGANVTASLAPHEADAPFRDALGHLPDALEESFGRLVINGPLPLEGTEVTRAVLLRMSAFYKAQWRIKEFLGKRYVGAAADFFVETVAFFLKSLVTTHDLDIEVAAERQVRRARGAMRPDISLWVDDHCLACIECKTQLGWNRHGWESQFVDREQRLWADFPDACSFLLVLSARNWGGFGQCPQLGQKYFVLSSAWPTDIEFDQLDGVVITPIESLFRRLVELAQSDRAATIPIQPPIA